MHRFGVIGGFVNILHPTDFSAASAKALELAQYLRQQSSGQLTILHVLEAGYAGAAHFVNSETEAIFQEAEKNRHKLLTQRLATLDAQANTHMLQGKPIPKILELAIQHDLVVMGTHAEDSLQDRLMGTTTERVIGQSETPVLAVPLGSSFSGLRSILVATALGGAGERGLALAQQLASLNGAKVTLLHVSSVADPGNLVRLSQLAAPHPEVETKEMIYGGSTDEALLTYATEQHASLLVLGRSTHARFFGTVTRSVLNRSKVPVLVHP